MKDTKKYKVHENPPQGVAGEGFVSFVILYSSVRKSYRYRTDAAHNDRRCRGTQQASLF